MSNTNDQKPKETKHPVPNEVRPQSSADIKAKMGVPPPHVPVNSIQEVYPTEVEKNDALRKEGEPTPQPEREDKSKEPELPTETKTERSTTPATETVTERSKEAVNTQTERSETVKPQDVVSTAIPTPPSESEVEFLQRLLKIQEEGGWGKNLHPIINDRIKLLSKDDK